MTYNYSLRLVSEIKLLLITLIASSTIVYVSTNKTSQIHYAAVLMDQQLEYTEYMIVSSREYTKYELLDGFEDLLKDDNFPYPPERKKRLLLLQKCWSMVGDRMHNFLSRHNNIYRGYFDIMFPDDVIEDVKTEEELRKEHVQFSFDLKHFFLNELPTYYHEYGRNMGVDFSQDELEKDLKYFKDVRDRGTAECSKFAERMGVDDDNHTSNHNTDFKKA